MSGWRPWLAGWAAALLAGVMLGPAHGADDSDGIAFFEKKIRPVLVEQCYQCHSSQAKALEGSLSLETREGLLKGGDLGPAIVSGNPEKSLLIQALRHEGDAPEMPPKKKLSDAVIADFVAWIKRGAPDPRTGEVKSKYAVDIDEARQQWPFTAPVRPAVPTVKNKTWPKNDIDRFVLAKMEEHGLSPVTDADKRALIRRVNYDLIGLPPSPEEVNAFLADHSPQALAKVVDRLLASQQYGERWGRHWLDVVRYADTAGDNSDYPIPQMYRYRNWVIQALNDDKPYNQFIREQLAGDLLPAASDEQRQSQIIATGYIANARRFGSRVADYPQHLTIEDTIDNLGRAFLGLSLNCARCHNHKFDPVTAEDYYALYGIFHSTRYPWPGIELDKRQRDLVSLATQEEFTSAVKEREAEKRKREKNVKAAESAKKEADQSVSTAIKELDEAKKAGKPKEELKDKEDQLAATKKEAAQRDQELKQAKQERDNLNKAPLPIDYAYAVAEGKTIENAKLQMKGDPERLGAEVPRRFPTVFGGQTLPPDEKGSGRLELADWIADAKNPLTARVIVNRLWHYHFGRGIVATPNDFGRQGKPPTHPELLDYLALQLIDHGWSLKATHRLIVLSRTYQMSCDESPAASQTDPNNELLSHFNRRRLDAESLRDTLLLLGGNLDPTMGGEHPFPPQNQWDFTQHKPFKAVYETNRRSIYLMTQRIQRHPYLAIFDGPDTGASTGSRITSTTTLQALYLLNDEFLHEQAAHFAAQIMKHSADDAQRIDRAYQLAFSRPPTADERTKCANYLKTAHEKLNAADAPTDQQAIQAWQSLCRVLLRTNEFVYLE